MNLIHNERTKLLAKAFDRASTAHIAAGWIAMHLNEHRDRDNHLHPGE